jgi:hypothetical protein
MLKLHIVLHPNTCGGDTVLDLIWVEISERIFETKLANECQVIKANLVLKIFTDIWTQIKSKIMSPPQMFGYNTLCNFNISFVL